MRNALAILLVVAISVMAAGCGKTKSVKPAGSSAPPTTASTPITTTPTTPAAPATGATTLALKAVMGSNAFDKTTLSAKAGKITLKLTNPDTVPHQIGADDPNGNSVGPDGPLVTSGGVSTITFTAKPGVYKYYCKIHESVGMIGHLTVS